MKNRKGRVVLSTAPVGVNFGCIGVVRRASDWRVLYRSETPRPHAFTQAALADARAWATAHGYLEEEGSEQ